jgi:hypothetical protein
VSRGSSFVCDKSAHQKYGCDLAKSMNFRSCRASLPRGRTFRAALVVAANLRRSVLPRIPAAVFASGYSGSTCFHYTNIEGRCGVMDVRLTIAGTGACLRRRVAFPRRAR